MKNKFNYKLIITDSTNWVYIVDTDSESGKIGHEYKFKPVKARIVKKGYDESDFHYFRKAKSPIPVGTEVMLDCWWMNFYGAYYRIEYNGERYDVKIECIEIDRKAFLKNGKEPESDNVKRLDEISEPRDEEEKRKLELRVENRDWIPLSQRIAITVLNKMQESEISKEELAERMEMPVDSVSDILKGEENMTLKTIRKLEKSLGIELISVVNE